MDGREDGSVHCGTCTTKIRPVDSLLGASLISEQPRNLVLQQSRYSTDRLICGLIKSLSEAQYDLERQFPFFINPCIKQSALYLLRWGRRLGGCFKITLTSRRLSAGLAEISLAPPPLKEPHTSKGAVQRMHVKWATSSLCARYFLIGTRTGKIMGREANILAYVKGIHCTNACGL